MKTYLGLFLLCIWAPAFAEQARVTLGASLFPPSAYIDEGSGKCVGENIEVASKILAHYNIELEVVCALPIRMYRLVERSEVDFTVNVKSTRALKPYVELIEPPLKQLIINLYHHGAQGDFRTISAIRGFDYEGGRQRLTEQHYQFIDLPTAASALELFLKGRSDALISYQSNVLHLQRQTALVLPEGIKVTPLLRVNAYFAVAKGSPHFELLKRVFNDYAEQHQLTYFVQTLAE
ncbi:hypothetical protein [Alteromonas sp. CYL-A6]|uniref:hypothetical protein n=1 Tax=Alteromonas nitratireducens TaxID=3390813 RepID=UPI0034AB548C